MVRGNISHAPKHLYSAQKWFHPAKYILVVPPNIYMSAQIFIWLRRYSWACAEIFWLARKYFRSHGNIEPTRRILFTAAEIYVLRGNIFKLHANKKFARGNYHVPAILGMPLCRD
jgi:hypothetical protein